MLVEKRNEGATLSKRLGRLKNDNKTRKTSSLIRGSAGEGDRGRRE